MTVGAYVVVSVHARFLCVLGNNCHFPDILVIQILTSLYFDINTAKGKRQCHGSKNWGYSHIFLEYSSLMCCLIFPKKRSFSITQP